jgi:hypothetical protein
MYYVLICDNIDTFIGILYNDNRIKTNRPTGKLLVYKHLTFSLFQKKSNLVNNIKTQNHI